ncbi:hypothetical protein GLOIN_2v1770909 [Rhizophagus irregularis DAOM 181602=DAOM 197198]|uniref:Uncharacterized protein n=1 Tax=Rhizophagus irregularis (strain DAOM 181602 / DAOM 197198 / MUCL 43194) TaxID=747089 RepID=A0A2P4QB42_RHIID|nr:hypothetical protein GLOIN_2v1770909 [Rhizophagus irregularis DAOM 181602=DAOM 197198]POG74853.1 hypothetical protein GLOIN_2v1770909 [Rhizophagus irregularis DAOM 181602=DAOM 197198]|eukprot:XP_025181719.1 hypothetical protein GLOIN_2v1770909 [Rhizophagus irregularis DAOM 181602=DAOM 197198]
MPDELSVPKNLLTALKEWEEAGEPFEDDDELAFIEYKESKAYKNGERPGSFGEILRTNSAGFTPTRMIRPGRRARLLPPESENNPIPPHIIVNDLKLLSYIGKYVNIRKYKENETRLNSPASIGDLVHKCESLYALIYQSRVV